MDASQDEMAYKKMPLQWPYCNPDSSGLDPTLLKIQAAYNVMHVPLEDRQLYDIDSDFCDRIDALYEKQASRILHNEKFAIGARFTQWQTSPRKVAQPKIHRVEIDDAIHPEVSQKDDIKTCRGKKKVLDIFPLNFPSI